MYRAFSDAGHELMLIVRPNVAPMVRHAAPGARVIELPYEVYSPDLAGHWDQFGSLFDAARSFAPDALIVAPYRWTLFDERLAEELPGVKRFGLSGHLYAGDPHHGRAQVARLRFDGVAEVCEDAPEVGKNAELARVVLGQSALTLPNPHLEVHPPHSERAAQILSDIGFTPGEYWIACVTGTAHVSLKAWHRERWTQVLRQWAERRGRKFLFVGLASEEADARVVRGAMGDAGERHTRLWMPPGGTIDELIGLTALSGGYVGHDTGPMHVAAALGKPVLAVFGGGHKLRFQPAVEPSVTLTVGVSCRGCEWVCSFAESHCVKDVPVDEVLRAADDLEDGRVNGREARVLEPTKELQAKMIAESASVAQERLRESVELSRELQKAQTGWQNDVGQLREQLRATQENTEAVVAEQRAAVERAHEELGSQLREKEAAILQQHEQLREKEAMIHGQDEQLREMDSALRGKDAAIVQKEAAILEKESALHEQHAMLQRQSDAMHRAAEEAERLRGHATAASRQTEQLNAALEARAGELSRLQNDFEAKAREAADLASTVHVQREEIERLHRETSVALQKVEQSNRENAETAKRQADETAKLREQLLKLDERLRVLEPRVRPPRRPFKQVLVEFIIGPQHFYPPPPKPLPGITVVTITHNDERTIRDTVDSVLGQTHAHVQYIVIDRGSTDSTLAILAEYHDRLKLITETATTSDVDALSTGYSAATYDVLARLDAGDVYEPGALTRVAEHFRDHPGQMAAVFEEAVAEDGWRFPAPPPTTPDVYQLLVDSERAPTSNVFVTTNAYKALHGLNRERGQAAEWDLWLRMARRYGINVGAGHVRTIRRRENVPADSQRSADYARSRELFESSFGLAGRVRATFFHWCNRLDDAVRRMVPARLSFPTTLDAKPMPTGIAPSKVPADQPVCPLDGRLPDRLLFSARDTVGDDDAISYVYYDDSTDAAMVYPPIDLEKLRAIYDRDRRERPKHVTPPDQSRLSPYAGFRGRGSIARLLSRLRSPYWWFAKPDFDDPGVTQLLATLDGPIPRRGVSARLLVVGCFEGAVLDGLKQLTDWQLAGTETNPEAAQAARAKGHTVWETSAEDAALLIPEGKQFDVIYLDGLLEHLADPLLVLRRLRQLLAPNGRIVIDTPNLDSKLLDVFGPTWSQWQLPYHRTLIGRRGLRKLARRGSFRIERVRTRTHPLAAVKSVQLNELGLGAIVPDTAEFPPEVASRGVLLTGWARLLWDWRGRGDYLYAVLRAE